MAVDSDAKLTDLAAEILRDAVRVYDRGDIGRWLAGCAPVIAAAHAEQPGFEMIPSGWDMTGSFPAIGAGTAGAGAVGAARGAAAQISLKTVFGLPGTLPPVRLPSDADMASRARAAPLMRRLEALAGWLGSSASGGAGGRLVGPADELSDADAADAAGRLGIDREYLSYLWEYALNSGWFELDDEPAVEHPGRPGHPGRPSRTWAVLGQTARRWADGDDCGAMYVWAVVFASVLAAALEVAASADPGAARKLNFRGQGVAVGLLLFLATCPGRPGHPGRQGLSRAEVSELVMDGSVGDPVSSRMLRAWQAWVRAYGDPARVLLRDLADLGAVTMPQTGSGAVTLTPLASWALCEQLAWDGVEVPLLPANPARMSAADLVTISADATEAGLAGEAGPGHEWTAWVASRGPQLAARELLAFAASADARARLVAVNLTRRIGRPADPAWRDAMRRPELRGYARIALTATASELPDSTMPLVLEPAPDDLTWVATDLLALACGDTEPDPRQVAAQFREAVPAGQESWIFDLMSRGSHPDVVRVLTVLARHHPDRRVARSARRASHAAAQIRAARIRAGRIRAGVLSH